LKTVKKDEDITLVLTYQCNWACEYCIVDTHDQIPKEMNEVLAEIETYEENSSVTLGGGEPGMLGRADLQIIFNKLKEKNITIDLLTNGLFLKKYPELLIEIDEVFYHCVEDLTLKKDIELFDKDNLHYILVASSDNLGEDLEYYFNKYPDIEFVLSANVKPGERVEINKFLTFIKKYPNNISKRTMIEFIKNTAKA